MKFEDIELFIKEAQNGEHEKDEIIDVINKVTEMKEDASLEVQEEQDIYFLQEELKKVEEFRSKCDFYRSTLEEILSTYKSFDKARFFSNMRYLLKKTDGKIGQIEKQAGVRVGYASRLEKEGNTSSPSIEFVSTAAKALGVTVDFLLYAKIEEMTRNEEYILRFLNNVLEDTKNENLMWKREGARLLNDTYVYNDYGGQSHPLFTVNEDDVDGYGNAHSESFHTLFFSEKNVNVTDNVYSTPLPRTLNTLYIVPCSIFTSEDDAQECYEVYITGDDTPITPLCSTLLTCSVVEEAVKNLYLHAGNSCSHIQVTQTARTIIDAYMGIGEPMTKPKKQDDSDPFSTFDEELPFN